MKRPLLCAMIGLMLGGLFGALWAFAVTRIVGSDPTTLGGGWTAYPTLASSAIPAPAVWQFSASDAANLYFAGVFWGCGFGVVAGAIVGGTGAIVRAIKENRPKPGPPPLATAQK